VPNVIRLPIAVASSPSSSPSQAITVVATTPPSGVPRRSTRRRKEEPGSVPSRAIENMPRAVPPCAAIPQARKATRTIAVNGFDDHDPNEPTTAVVTGSRSWPATTAAGSGCASVVANAFTITSAPTLSSAIQTARGTWRAAPCVSSAIATVASKPMNAQPPTASAASSAAPTEPPESASAPSVSVTIDGPCSRNTSSSATAMTTDAIASAATPALSARFSASMPHTLTAEHSATRTKPAITVACGVGVIPSSASAQGAPR
jgi:hypothetical protein